MNIYLNKSLAEGYKKGSQIARVLTQDWVARELVSPCCFAQLVSYPENNRGADYYCPSCGVNFELKASKKKFGKKVAGAEYNTTMNQLQLDRPHFLLLRYDDVDWRVVDLVVIHNEFMHPGIVSPRKKLRKSARRSGWKGCVLNIGKIGPERRISLISDGCPHSAESIKKAWLEVQKIAKEYKSRPLGTWTQDVLSCVERIESIEFSLRDVYSFADELREKHPNNRNVKPKIRQQLQVLRDRGVIFFVRPGIYQKVIG